MERIFLAASARSAHEVESFSLRWTRTADRRRCQLSRPQRFDPRARRAIGTGDTVAHREGRLSEVTDDVERLLGRPLERRVQYDLAAHAYLVRRDASLEEVRHFLNVLQIHEGERILPSVTLGKTERRQPLVRAELEVEAHVRDGEADDPGAEQVLRKLRLALDGLVEHFEDRPGKRFVEEVRLFASNGPDDLERKRHVGALVAEYPIGPRG